MLLLGAINSTGARKALVGAIKVVVSAIKVVAIKIAAGIYLTLL